MQMKNWAILSRDRVTIDGFRTDDRIYCTLGYNAWLYFTVHYHTLIIFHSRVFTVVAWWRLSTTDVPFLWVPERSPASAASFSRNSSQRLKSSSPVTYYNSKSKFCYHRRLVGQYILQSNPILGPKTSFLLLSLASESHGIYDHILLSQIRDSQPGGPGPRIYIPQEQRGQVRHSGTGFPLRRLLRLAGLRWRC
jgi:hypothetical protein